MFLPVWLHHFCFGQLSFKSYRKKNGVMNQILLILYGFLSYTHWDSSYHLYLFITTWITSLSILFWESLRLLNLQFCLSGVVVWDVSYKSQGLEYLVASWKNCLGRLGRYDLLEEVSQWGRLKDLITFYHPLSLCVFLVCGLECELSVTAPAPDLFAAMFLTMVVIESYPLEL